MHAGRACTNHAFHQFEGIQIAAKSGLGIGNDRREPVDARVTVQRVDFIGALECIVDACHHLRHRIDRVQALVRIHLTGTVAVAGNLPARTINRLESCLDFLNRLVAGQRAQCAQAVFPG